MILVANSTQLPLITSQFHDIQDVAPCSLLLSRVLSESLCLTLLSRSPENFLSSVQIIITFHLIQSIQKEYSIFVNKNNVILYIQQLQCFFSQNTHQALQYFQAKSSTSALTSTESNKIQDLLCYTTSATSTPIADAWSAATAHTRSQKTIRPSSVCNTCGLTLRCFLRSYRVSSIMLCRTSCYV